MLADTWAVSIISKPIFLWHCAHTLLLQAKIRSFYSFSFFFSSRFPVKPSLTSGLQLGQAKRKCLSTILRSTWLCPTELPSKKHMFMDFALALPRASCSLPMLSPTDTEGFQLTLKDSITALCPGEHLPQARNRLLSQSPDLSVVVSFLMASQE